MLVNRTLKTRERRYQAMGRSTEEVKARCSIILNDERVVSLVRESSSPSAAYEMVFAETRDIAKAKAGRWLAVLRRDYIAEYRKLVPTKSSHVSNDTAQTETEKEKNNGKNTENLRS